ncbi:MAG: hypothetical protein ETSY2_37165 [Candidatus Entotheonella gemina]|uniref:Uncharacterized protein n=1 Tax=Candidatus Entotheonella gemina TaxID=1429439 RepID=W4LTV4_9BACT|nr:MAG: hypothetical protein ETSY2_37165 [Candidatus Entotheonella gemina]
MIDLKAKDEFWAIVEECLVELYRLPTPDARQRSEDMRIRIEAPPTGMSSEIFYHSEPYDVACGIMGVDPNLPQHSQQYDSILSRHSW